MLSELTGGATSPSKAVKEATLRGSYRKCLDKGYIRLVDWMGNDVTVVRAARVSHNADWRTGEDSGKDEKLINYLLKNKHCYHPTMQVLTRSGWKYWEDCGHTEDFLVPDPDSGKLLVEKLKVKSFGCDEDLIYFKNSRMSFLVTKEHTMRFATKVKSTYSTYKAASMPKWGNFDPSNNYSYFKEESPCPKYAFTGFYLGDGSYCSVNRISFHLKKKRKIEYLEKLLNKLNLSFVKKESSSTKGAFLYVVKTPSFLKETLKSKLSNRSYLKGIEENILSMSPEQVSGLLQGLTASDGCINKRRNKVEFSSSSSELLDIFELLSTLLGVQTTRTKIGSVHAHYSNRTTLEARSHFFGTKKYKGKVYCATTSTGWLLVRGGPREYAFVCGNTSPFEHVLFTFEVKCPIFVARQWQKHRTGKFNEVSGRYTELDQEFYVPNVSDIGVQDSTNKQKREVLHNNPSATNIKQTIETVTSSLGKIYKELLDQGCPKEVARMVLPLNTYTKFFFTLDLHNLFHFIKLRSAAGSQWEIVQYSNAVLDIITSIVPICVKSFKESL